MQNLLALARAGRDGRHWYYDAHNAVRRWCFDESFSFDRTCDLLALFSPRVSVTRSLRMTYHYLLTSTFTHDTTRSIRASVVHYERTGEIRGPKTYPFSLLLRDPSHPTAIVLDVWMSRALSVPHRRLATISGAKPCFTAIRRTASLLGWLPSEAQAAIWTATVRAHDRTPYPLCPSRATLGATHAQANRPPVPRPPAARRPHGEGDRQPEPDPQHLLLQPV